MRFTRSKSLACSCETKRSIAYSSGMFDDRYLLRIAAGPSSPLMNVGCQLLVSLIVL